MSLAWDLTSEVKAIFRRTWTERDGYVVPDPENLKLGNDAVNLDATVLYADMSDSTKLVDQHPPTFAAEIYKSYLHCASNAIKQEDGVITAFDGDRVMAIFLGESKNTSAVRCAMKINFAVRKIINPAIIAQYGNSKHTLSQVVGVDTSKLLAARIGVRNDNDLVWVGRAANYAAKLSNLDISRSTLITDNVFRVMSSEVKYSSQEKKLMWEPRTWTQMNGMRIHASSWTWAID